MERGQGRHLIIKADASSQIGTGHFMRCLALAQAWKDAGGQVIFITACESENLLQRLQEEDFDIHLLSGPYPDAVDWGYTNDIMAEHPGTWVVLDGYHFDEVYQRWVKDSGHSLLVIDDMAHLKHYYADIVLNQNLHAEQLRYPCEPYTHLLLGTQYVLLRREFLTWKDWKRDIPEVARRVLVTLGGGDPENHTLKVIQALQRVDIPALEATVVIGASNPHTDMLEAAVEQSRIPIRLIRNAENMPELMAWADVAVSTAGATVWELAFMGVPTIVGMSAPVEEFLVNGLEKHGLFLNIGWLNRLSVDQLVDALKGLIQDDTVRSDMSILGQHLVDGVGCEGVLKWISHTKPGSRVSPHMQ